MAAGGLEFDFDGDGEAAAGAEGLLRDFEHGRGLLALVFAALDEGEDATDEGEIDGYSPPPLIGDEAADGWGTRALASARIWSAEQ